MLATNKVSTRTAASITNQSATAGGALAVTASDAATIASNVKVVSNSITTTDSGLHFLGKLVDGSVPATYTTASGSRTVGFGTTVRVVHGYATPRFTTDDPTTVALKTGDRIRVRDGYAGGGDPGVYKYLGPDVSLKPSTQDYSNAAAWVLVAGADDVVYRYMGGTPVTLDLGATDYTDLRFWKPEQATQIVPINVNFDTSDSRAIAGAIILNDVSGGATARIDGATVSAGSVAVRATEAATITAGADISASSAGGSTLTGMGASLAAGGVLAVNRVLAGATAAIAGGSVTTTAGDLTVTAALTATVEASNASAMTSGAQSVGLILAFNTIGWKPGKEFWSQAVDAILGGPVVASLAYNGEQPALASATITGTPLTVGGGLSVSAEDAATITAAQTNNATSAPGAIMGAGGMAAAMIVASNMISSGAQASVTFAAGAGTVTASGAVSVTAADTAAIVASTAQYAEVSPTNDAGAGILNRYADAITRDYAFTQQSGTQPVKFGQLVRADDGTVYRYMGVDATLDLGAQDYADYGRWKALEPANLITDAVAYAALNAIGTALGREGLTGAADAYFGLVDTNYVKSVVSASISHVALTAGGDVTVSATEAASISATDDSYVSTWAGKGGLIVTNIVVADATASVTDGSLAGAAIAVTASTTAKIEATSTTKIEAFDKSLGFVAVFNTIGWKPSNLLFNLVDAILGDPLTSSAFNGDATPSAARAFIRDTPVTATGALSVTAIQAAQLTATAGNEGLADAALDAVLMTAWQTNGLAGGGLLASNKVNTTAEASLSFTGAGTVQAGGAVAVTATDSAGVESHSTLTETANVSNTAAGLAAYLDRLVPLDYDYTTASGARTLATGDHVRVGPTYGGAGIKGAVYVFNGAPGSVALGAENYLDTVRWTRVDTSVNPSAFYPNLGNLTKSSANAIGVLIVLNDVRATATATVTKVTLTGASVLVGATESAQILAEATNAITASGGSFYGSGTVLAVSGQMVTNRVVTHTTATLSASTVTATAGDIAVTADNAAGIDATLLDHAQQRRPGRVGLAGVQHAWLQALQRALQPDRRDPRRSADLDGVQGRGPGARARHRHGHDAHRDRHRQGLRDQPRRAQRHREQRRALRRPGRCSSPRDRRSARSWPPTRSPAAPARRSTAARSRRPARSRSPPPTPPASTRTSRSSPPRSPPTTVAPRSSSRRSTTSRAPRTS